MGGKVGGMAPTYLQATSAGGGGSCSNWIVQQQGARMAPYLCLDLCDQKEQSVIRAQIVVFAGDGPFCVLLLPQTMSCYRNMWA